MTSLAAAARNSIQLSLRRMAAIQGAGGEWEAEMVWSPVILAQYLIVRWIIGRPAPRALHEEYLRHFTRWQTGEGGWGLHEESPAYLFVTALVYVAMRSIGVPPDDERLVRGRALIRELGTPLKIPTWGKLWLAFCNLYEFEGVHPIPPEIWLIPRFVPFHPWRFYCHTRQIYLGLCYLYGKRFRRGGDALCQALREELYGRPYGAINFRAARGSLTPRDIFEAPSRLLRAVYLGLNFAEHHHSKALRRSALAKALARIEYEQRSTGHAALSPVNGLLNILALFASDPHHPDIELSLAAVERWQWRDENGGVRYAGARSQTWDTAFAVQAALACEADESFRPALRRAGAYLRSTQIRDELADGSTFDRDPRRGGWCFSDSYHGWPVSDTTAEALCASLALHEQGLGALQADAVEEAVRFLLSRQNANGGWGSYERRRGSLLLERMNPSEMFGNCMVEHSYVECSASAIDALARFCTLYPSHMLTKASMTAVARGVRFILREQRNDGAWPGFWGINFTYGTFFAVRGLLAGGRATSDPAIRRACDWLVAHQKADGGWGEHWASAVQGCYIEHPRSQVIMTAWALITLLLAADPRRDTVERGIALLVARQEHNGGWPKEGVNGVFFNTAMLHYGLYREYFPLWALGLFNKCVGQ